MVVWKHTAGFGWVFFDPKMWREKDEESKINSEPPCLVMKAD